MNRKTLQNALKYYKTEGFTNVNLNASSEDLETALFDIAYFLESKLNQSVTLHSLAVNPKKYVKLLKEPQNS